MFTSREMNCRITEAERIAELRCNTAPYCKDLCHQSYHISQNIATTSTCVSISKYQWIKHPLCGNITEYYWLKHGSRIKLPGFISNFTFVTLKVKALLCVSVSLPLKWGSQWYLPQNAHSKYPVNITYDNAVVTVVPKSVISSGATRWGGHSIRLSIGPEERWRHRQRQCDKLL